MLKPIISNFSVENDLLKDVIRFLFFFGKNRIRISGEYLMKSISDKMDDREKSVFGSNTLLEQPFDLFYKYLILFLDDQGSIPNSVASHIEFKFSRKVVWEYLSFLMTLDDNLQIKKNVIINHLKNTETFFDNEPFCKFSLETITEIIDEEYPFTVAKIENVFFFLSKIIALFNFIKVNNTVINSINKVISGNDVAFDSEAIGDIQGVVEEMSGTAVSGVIDELVLDEDNLDVGMENLNFPIVPVTVFNDMKFFQEKRVFLFVGASGIGKSMVMCHIASEMWLTTAYKKAPREAMFYFTMENLKEEITARVIANALYTQCGVNKTIDDIVSGNFSSVEKNLLRQKIREAGRILIVEYLPPKVYGTSMFRNLIKKNMYERNVKPYGIIIDYLDAVRYEGKRVKDEHQELGELVNEFKGLASEFSVPVISPSHLNADGCKMVKEDMQSLGGRQVGKSLRKYENADCVTFVDEEDTGGLQYNIMNFFNSKHRYSRSLKNKIFQTAYLPEYSFLGSMATFQEINGNKKPEQSIGDIFSDDTIGL